MVKRFFSWLFGTALSADPTELDFIPVTGSDCRTPEKIAQAREKLGRPFSPEIKVQRASDPSHVLDHINAQTEAAQKRKATVTRLDGRKKK